MPLQGIVYILTNKNNTTLYTGVTRNLKRRVAEHKLHINKGFSDRYNTEKLVYYEVYDLLVDGIHREKQLKKWHREWKEKLISDFNPTWEDLADSIGLDEEYMQSVKEAYENGIMIWRHPKRERWRVKPAMRTPALGLFKKALFSVILSLNLNDTFTAKPLIAGASPAISDTKRRT